MGRAVLVMALFLATTSLVVAKDKTPCETCEELVNNTRTELKEHAGDAKAFMLKSCDSSPALLKATCVQVATSAGDTIEKLLLKAYDTITVETMCSTVCKDELSSVPDVEAELAVAVSEVEAALDATATQMMAALTQAALGPFDVACTTCKNGVQKAKTFIKEHQTDVRDFMYKKCESMKDVDPVKCKETADEVADKVEASLETIYATLDEATICALFCPAPTPPSLSDSMRKYFNRALGRQ